MHRKSVHVNPLKMSDPTAYCQQSKIHIIHFFNAQSRSIFNLLTSNSFVALMFYLTDMDIFQVTEYKAINCYITVIYFSF